MKIFTLLTSLFIIVLSSTATAEIYKWRDKDGKLHFSDKRPKQTESTKVRLKQNTYNSNNSSALHVTIYSTQWCAACKQAKRYFALNKIPFTNYDIEKSKSARAAYEKFNVSSVPLILVGNEKLIGFTPQRFKQFYAKLNKPAQQ